MLGRRRRGEGDRRMQVGWRRGGESERKYMCSVFLVSVCVCVTVNMCARNTDLWQCETHLVAVGHHPRLVVHLYMGVCERECV